MSGLREQGLVWSIVAGVVAVAIACSLNDADSGYDALTNARGAIVGLFVSGWPAGAYLLGAFGLGRLARPTFRASPWAGTIQMGAGLALMLSLSHGLGVLGLLSTPVAIGVTLIGCGLAAQQIAGTIVASKNATDGRGSATLSYGWIAWAPGAAVLVVACAAPPGMMWASEYGQYDSLSYHLQLPQEWWRAGRVWPVEHNVYSFLPGYVESAFTHLSALTAAPVDGAGWTGEPGQGLLAGTGWRALAPHYLHAGMGLISAWTIAVVVRALAARVMPNANSTHARTIGVLSLVVGGAVLATPWVVVVGSISYNELGAVALGACALLVALDEKITPAWRGVLTGALVGAACGCKPTALFMVGPAVGIVLLGMTPRPGLVRTWAKIILPGAAAGVVALSPWLIRNELAAGNPVFPAMAGVFGEGHWSEEQHVRWRGAHMFEGGLAERVQTLMWESSAAVDEDGQAVDSAQRPLVERFRGAANPQWGVLFAIGIAGGVLALVRSRTRRAAAVLLVGLGAQLGCWLVLTHLQSRFLLPCVMTLGPLVGLGLASLLIARGDAPVRAWRPLALGWLAAAAQAGFLLAVLVQEGGVRGVGIEPAFRAGRPWANEISPALASAVVSDALERGELGDDAKVYLFAEATPFYYEKSVVYNTTYDAWLLGELVWAWPDEPEAWVDGLRDRGITHVLFNSDEYSRLTRSGWSDPVLTEDIVRTWVAQLGTVRDHWPRPDGTGGTLLFELPPDPRDAVTEPGP